MKRILRVTMVLGLSVSAQIAQADWTPAKRLTWNSGYSRNPAIAADGSGHLHVVWHDDTPGNFEIYYKKSTDGGASWTTAKRLTWTSAASEHPAIAVDPSGRLHVVWYDNTPGNAEIYYRKSTDGGTTWTTIRRLTWNAGGSYSPSMAADPAGHLHLAWSDDTYGNAEIYYKKSTDGGATWTAKQRLTWNAGGSGYPSIAVDPSSNPRVVWEDESPGNYEVYFKMSSNGGATWATSRRLTWNAGISGYPSMAASSSDNLHVVWYDDTPGNDEIYYRKSPDGGATWAATRRLTWTSGNSSSPAIAADSSGDLSVVWQDKTPGNYEVYCRKSPDGGGTWTTSKRLTWNLGSSEGSVIAVDPSSNLHVLWSDNTPGNYEVYYKKFIN